MENTMDKLQTFFINNSNDVNHSDIVIFQEYVKELKDNHNEVSKMVEESSNDTLLGTKIRKYYRDK